MRTFPGWSFALDEVHPLIARDDQWCTLKRKDRRSLFPWPPPRGASIARPMAAARKDSAVHVSLSSYSLVKQPGPSLTPPRAAAQSRRNSMHPKTVGCLVHCASEELHRRAVAP